MLDGIHCTFEELMIQLVLNGLKLKSVAVNTTQEKDTEREYPMCTIANAEDDELLCEEALSIAFCQAKKRFGIDRLYVRKGYNQQKYHAFVYMLSDIDLAKIANRYMRIRVTVSVEKI